MKPLISAQRRYMRGHAHPVLGLGAAGAGVDGDDGVLGVMFAVEHALQFHLVDALAQVVETADHLGRDSSSCSSTAMSRSMSASSRSVKFFSQTPIRSCSWPSWRCTLGLVLVVPEVGADGLPFEQLHLLPLPSKSKMLLEHEHAALRVPSNCLYSADSVTSAMVHLALGNMGVPAGRPRRDGLQRRRPVRAVGPAVAWKSVHDSHNRRTSQGKPLPPVRGPLNRWSSAPAGRCRPGPGTPGRCAGTPPAVRGRPR